MRLLTRVVYGCCTSGPSSCENRRQHAGVGAQGGSVDVLEPVRSRTYEARIGPILIVAQPTLFEFAINTRIAREVGLAIPPTLKISADIVA